MNLHTLISILVWVAVMCFARVVSVITELPKRELVDKLNMLLRHSGWRLMSNVNIIETYTINNEKHEAIIDPMSEIYEAMSSNRNPVDEINVLRRYDQIWTVLRCKYAEVLENYRAVIRQLIQICRNEKKEDKYQQLLSYRNDGKTPEPSHPRYFDCFHSLLTKLYIAWPRFKCMTHALDFIYSIGPKLKPNQNIVLATRKLTEFTSTLKPNTLSKLSKHGIDEDVVDLEIKNISKYFIRVFHLNIDRFVDLYCNLPSLKKGSTFYTHKLNEDFQDKKSNNQIPPETTMVQYVLDEIDSFINEIFDSMFYKLGLVYGVEDNVSIAII
ncbi:uncharacterized protein LOC126845835 isoform X1 [Adelges cooleyi]|uniref:uncharacterized protein LOC126845835 isoform X1 n=1 Tax=Adelges cooleyi TaxID=133065 RepID=UPI00217FCBD1|nr:uncharacterized protein LOC126845835 isoform X1 [Adelges cooleyi]